MTDTDEILKRARSVESLSQIGLPAAYDEVNDAMLVLSRDGIIIYCNRATTSIFGYAIREMLEQPVEMLVPEAIRASHAVLRDGFVAHPSSRHMSGRRPVRALHKNGTEMLVAVALSYVETSHGILPVAQVHRVIGRDGEAEW